MTHTALFTLTVAFASIQSAPARDVQAGATSTASQATLPVECEAFLNRVDRCMQKLGPDNAIATAYKHTLQIARTEWQSAPDPVVVGNVCHLASQAFDKTAAEANCESHDVAVLTP